MLEKFDNKKNPFKVPENYFADFNAEIMDKLPAKETGKSNIVPLWRKIVPWTAVAAVIGGIIFVSGIFTQETTITGAGNGNIADNHQSSTSVMLASYDEEEYYFAFLENEVTKAEYNDMLYNLQ